MAAPLLLIDSYSQIYRGYYAIRALATAQGIPSNAVFAMTKLLMKLKEEYEGYEGAFVFDKGRPAQRMALAPAYKANRPPDRGSGGKFHGPQGSDRLLGQGHFSGD